MHTVVIPLLDLLCRCPLLKFPQVSSAIVHHFCNFDQAMDLFYIFWGHQSSGMAGTVQCMFDAGWFGDVSQDGATFAGVL